MNINDFAQSVLSNIFRECVIIFPYPRLHFLFLYIWLDQNDKNDKNWWIDYTKDPLETLVAVRTWSLYHCLYLSHLGIDYIFSYISTSHQPGSYGLQSTLFKGNYIWHTVISEVNIYPVCRNYNSYQSKMISLFS